MSNTWKVLDFDFKSMQGALNQPLMEAACPRRKSHSEFRMDPYFRKTLMKSRAAFSQSPRLCHVFLGGINELWSAHPALQLSPFRLMGSNVAGRRSFVAHADGSAHKCQNTGQHDNGCLRNAQPERSLRQSSA